MKVFRSGSYAMVASTAALVVALGGTSYAAAQITSSDIKDGTIQTKDVNPTARTTVKQVRNDNTTTMDSTTKTVLTANVGAGSFLVTSKVAAYSTTTSPYVDCWLTGPGGNTLDYSEWYLSGQEGYATISNQGVFTTNNATTVQLNCYGYNSAVYSKKLDITRVASVADLTGANVSKAPMPHRIAARH
jgi:hypothetical protein